MNDLLNSQLRKVNHYLKYPKQDLENFLFPRILNRGESLLITAGSLSTAVLWKVSLLWKLTSISTAGSCSAAVTLKSVILFLFYLKTSSCLGKKDSHFCLVYRKVYWKITISMLFHIRGNWSLRGSLSTALLWKVSLLY